MTNKKKKYSEEFAPANFVTQNECADNRRGGITPDTGGCQIASLAENIPGGICQCANDTNLTLLSMSNGFLSMLGYTHRDIENTFQCEFINMVYPADRAEMRASIYEQLKTGTELELEYRVLRKNGSPVWVLDKSRLIDDGKGGACFYCLLIEITDRKRQQEELRLMLERYQVIMDQATDIIFEWDIKQDSLNFSSNWYKKFGYNAISENISSRIPLSRNIHEEDMPAFIKIMRDTVAGVPYSETEFRIMDDQRRYVWCRIRATTQFDADRRPIKAIGVIVDIDTEKRYRQKLIDQAQCDALTGIYNKETTNVLVDQHMQRKDLFGLQALLIIDIDYFKTVNDTYGHLCGDIVLSDVATALRNHTRSTDLVGRIGGDEFLVYLPKVKEEEDVRKKVKDLLAELQTITPEKGAPPITCSVGAAVFPRGSIDYHTLYKYADQALYQKKKNGRDGVAFFGEESLKGEISSRKFNSAVGLSIGFDGRNTVDGQMAQYAFRTLHQSKDPKSAINRLLEIIGRSFDVSRVYIFERWEGGQNCANTFEWCNEGVEPRIGRQANSSYEDDLSDYCTNFDSEGMFYCREIERLHPDVAAILKLQGVRSMLQCAILDEGEFKGYVGFDECRKGRSWTRRQVESFRLTADVLSEFLIKLRLKQKLKMNS